MQFKNLKWLIVSAAVAGGIFFISSPAQAKGYHEIKVTPSEGQEGIQEALDKAHKNATSSKPYRITLKKGTYTLDSSLHIYSNTYLKAGKATLKADSYMDDNMLKVGAYASGYGEDNSSGFHYKNITVDGGIWNRRGKSGTSIKVGHAKNFTLKNAELCNTKNGHLVETAAVNGLTVKNCKFHDATGNGKSDGGECIQIDILVKEHFNGYEKLDSERDYVSKNITVQNCSFNNVVRAVGAHTGVYGIPFKNVKITNNKLKNIKDVGFILCNMQNLTMSGNSINCKDNGIEIYNIKDTRNGNFMPANGHKGYKNPETKGVIKNNTINSSSGNGIYLKGIKYSKAGKGGKSGDKIPAGDYCIKNVQITGNTVNAKGSGKSPIILLDSVKVSITKNRITGVNKSYYAIYIKDGSRNITVNNNTINGPFEAAVRTFNYDKGYGKNQISSINGNAITAKNGRNGISIMDATVNSIKNNRVTGTKEYSIRIDKGSNAKDISGNTVSKGKAKEIHISQGASGKIGKNKTV